MADGWKLKFASYFIERTREPLYLEKWSFVLLKVMDMLQVSYLSCYCFTKGFMNIAVTNTAAEKCWELRRTVNVFIFGMGAKEIGLWFQTLNATCFSYKIQINEHVKF
jgi:hypothetical protein